MFVRMFIPVFVRNPSAYHWEKHYRGKHSRISVRTIRNLHFVTSKTEVSKISQGVHFLRNGKEGFFPIQENVNSTSTLNFQLKLFSVYDNMHT